MIRKITQTYLEREEIDVTICDHCSLEATDPVEIVANPRAEFRSDDDEPSAIRLSQLLQKISISGDGRRIVCEDCWRELFDRPDQSDERDESDV